MSWHSVRGHDRIVESLRRSLGQGRFPHALFFVGPEGIGKRTFARKLAQALLCETRGDDELDPCGVCPGCVQVAGSTHPDLIEAGCPEDKHELPISVIRDLCDWFSLKPARGRRKVAIVDDADDLNEEASNAFLKTLEEPPPGAVLILIGTSPEIQLETIVSRCQVVRFDPLPEPEIAALLLEQGITQDPAEAASLAALSEGSVSRALGLTDAVAARVPSRTDRRARRRPRLPSSRAGPSAARFHQASGQGIGRPAPLRQPVDRRARPFLSRRPLGNRRTCSPLP